MAGLVEFCGRRTIATLFMSVPSDPKRANQLNGAIKGGLDLALGAIGQVQTPSIARSSRANLKPASGAVTPTAVASSGSTRFTSEGQPIRGIGSPRGAPSTGLFVVSVFFWLKELSAA